MIIFRLESENLSGLGVSMGTQGTSTNYFEHFQSLKSAKKYAQKDYEKSCKKNNNDIVKLKWIKNGRYSMHTQDLRYAMYNIKFIKVKK